MKWPKTSTAQQLNFGNEEVISFHTLLGMWLLFRVSKRRPGSFDDYNNNGSLKKYTPPKKNTHVPCFVVSSILPRHWSILPIPFRVISLPPVQMPVQQSCRISVNHITRIHEKLIIWPKQNKTQQNHMHILWGILRSSQPRYTHRMVFIFQWFAL